MEPLISSESSYTENGKLFSNYFPSWMSNGEKIQIPLRSNLVTPVSNLNCPNQSGDSVLDSTVKTVHRKDHFFPCALSFSKHFREMFS